MILTGHKSHNTLKALIFQKNFNLSAATNKEYTSGQILNLLERDAWRIWPFMWEFPSFFEIPFEIATGSYIVFTQVGYSAFAAALIFMFTIPLQIYQHSRRIKTEKEITKLKDKRMLQTSEAFNHAKNLKLYSWEQKFGDQISRIFEKEMALTSSWLTFKCVYLCIQELITSFMPLCLFTVYVYNGNDMSMS